MADSYYKLKPETTNPHTDWTTEVVLERDSESGEVTKAVGVNEPVQLNADEREKVKALGYSVEQTTKSEAEEAEASPAGGDVAAASPVFGTTSRPNQAANDQTKNDKS